MSGNKVGTSQFQCESSKSKQGVVRTSPILLLAIYAVLQSKWSACTVIGYRSFSNFMGGCVVMQTCTKDRK